MFLKNTLIAGALAPVANADLLALNNAADQHKLKVHIFSKHLQFLNYKDLAEAAAEMGFDGVDLSVRPKGHVEPERIEEDLPKAVAALKNAGLEHLLMTTAVNDANNHIDKKLLETAAKVGFTHYRMNWYNYPENKPMPEALTELAEKINGLGEFNRSLGLKGYYQNHAGINIGSVIWEIYELIKKADKNHMGVQYDIRHAMVEGAQSWENGFRLVHDRIQAISLKDFRWQQQKDGRWLVEDVPVGDGMIDFKSYFKLLKQYKIDVPASLHIEYPLGGAEKGNRTITVDRKDVFKAMKKDLVKIHQLWSEA
ncbi:MAG TPA: sugar phosphate isomerase/epimerase family protein [Flavitalea sp.]|nr:sugar phosphate isomerase/epimerase family protein [Flavitalea sp.]